MHTTRTILALLTTALVAAPLSLPGAAAQAPDLPPACADALTRARDAIAAQRETLDLPAAIALLEDAAGATCGLDLEAGTATVDEAALRAFAASWNTQSTSLRPLLALMRGEAAEPYPCMLPGVGSGTIVAEVLGITLGEESAKGEWHAAGPHVQVIGHGGAFGGTQTGPTGVIEVAGVPIPTLEKGTEATCVDATTTTVVEERCWDFGVYRHCTTRIETEVAVISCGATAHQGLLGLVRATHTYATGAEECEA